MPEPSYDQFIRFHVYQRIERINARCKEIRMETRGQRDYTSNLPKSKEEKYLGVDIMYLCKTVKTWDSFQEPEQSS